MRPLRTCVAPLGCGAIGAQVAVTSAITMPATSVRLMVCVPRSWPFPLLLVVVANVVPHHRVDHVLVTEAFERDRPGRTEEDVASRLDELAYEPRDEDLSTTRGIRDARCDDDVAAEQVATVAHEDFAGVHTDAHAQPVGRSRTRDRVQRALHVDCAHERAARAREAEHEPVAARLDLGAAVACDLAP